jgi:hypothetical protein
VLGVPMFTRGNVDQGTERITRVVRERKVETGRDFKNGRSFISSHGGS